MMRGFFTFIRTQGVAGLAVGFILGGAVAKFVTALVTDIINPLLGLLLSKAGNLKDASWKVGSAVLKWGDLVSVAIDFIIIALVVYFAVHLLGLDRPDKRN